MDIRILTPVVLGLTVAGCAGNAITPAYNRSLELQHQPVVSMNSYVFDADASDGTVDAVELHRLDGWLDAMELRYGDEIGIDSNDTVAPRPARDAVAALVARRGMLLADSAPLTAGQVAPGHVRIVLTRATARVDGCPNWQMRSATGSTTISNSNYGCATNANMAAMVANPADLVRGQRRNTNDPLTASKAINAYRSATPTGAGGLSGGGGGGGGSSSGGGQ